MSKKRINYYREVSKRLEETVAEWRFEVAPALYGRVEVGRVRKQRRQTEVVTGLQVRDGRRPNVRRSIQHDKQLIFDLLP